MTKEWIDNLDHAELKTPEAVQHLSKYDDVESALVGNINQAKLIGKPFKLPESLDKLPDDNTRSDFTSQVNKLLGAVEKEEDLADVDFADGLADARTQKDEITGAIKKWAIGKPKSIVKEVTKLINSINQQMLNATAADELKTTQEINGKLSALLGGDKAVADGYENVRRLFQNHMGLSEDEYNQGGKEFVEKVLMNNFVMSKGLINLAKETVKEGTTITGPGGGTTKTGEPASFATDESPTGKALGWS